MAKVLFVANVAKEHVLKFHIPTIKALDNMGWEVDVACAGDEEIPFCREQFKLCYQRATINLKTFKGIWQVCKIAKQNHYDIIYCHTAIGGVAGRVAKLFSKNKKVKVVFFSHGYDFCKVAPWWYWWTFFVAEWLMARLSDAIICINKEDYENTLYKLKPPKTYYIEGIGVDYSRFNVENPDEIRTQYRNEMSIPQDATVLTYLAELIPNKNQKLLVDTLKILHKNNKNIYLVLPGFDHYNGEIDRYATELGLKDYVKTLGWRNDVANIYAMSDICVASSRIEGLGLNLVEAMYCKLPVVATNNRGHSTVIEDGVNGYLINQDDAKQFASRIEELIQNPQKCKEFVEAGFETQKEYASDNIVKKIINILLEYVN